MAGYQLASVSPGIEEADARALSQWGPAHDALCAGATTSVNFHPLPSGAAAVSRTTAAGAEYSGRGGMRVYTQSLVASAATQKKYGGNAFRIYEAALLGGRLIELNQPPAVIDALSLPGRASAMNQPLIAELIQRPEGIAGLVSILDALLTHDSAVVVNCPRSQRICDGVINLLPPAMRLQVSFTTGLLPAGQRPFRLHVLPAEANQLLRCTWIQQAAMLEYAKDNGPVSHPWATAVQSILQQHSGPGRLSQVFQQNEGCEDLQHLAAELTPVTSI